MTSLTPRTLDEEKTWNQLEGEGGTAWVAFRTYRDLGYGRTIDRLLEKLGKDERYLGYIRRWSNIHFWEARALSFDMHRIEEKLRIREKVRELGVQAVFDLQPKAIAVITELLDFQDEKRPHRAAAIRLQAADKILKIGGVEAKESGAEVNQTVNVATKIDRLILELGSDAIEAIGEDIEP
jgi:hypothetical protein